MRRAFSAPIPAFWASTSRRLSSLPKVLAGRLVEPGHHYEWVWLLRRFEQISGRSLQPMSMPCTVLPIDTALIATGLIVDELLVDGSHHAPSRRIWPIAEAIKANLVEARRGRPQAEDKAASLAVLLRDRFLISEAAGGWHDRLDRNGVCLSEFMPASTLYHVVCAIDDLSQFAANPPG